MCGAFQRRYAKAEFMIFSRRFSLPVLALSLAACSPDHRLADVGKCVAKAQAEAPNSAGLSREELHDAAGAIVAECMKDLGYRHEMTDARCVDDVDFGAYCYVARR